MNLYFNNEEYFFVKDATYNGMKYTLFMDNNTRSKILILNDNKDIIIDEYLTNNIMSQIFRKYSEKYNFYDEFDFYSINIGDEASKEVPIDPKRFKELCETMKKIAHNQFEDILSKEEIDRRIDENLNNIVIDPSIATLGEYDHKSKKIILQSSYYQKTITQILYHEFLHALTHPGVQRLIVFGSDEEYEYGRGINEGIISVLQNNKPTKLFDSYKENFSYPYETELVELLKIVYENTNEAKETNANFYDEFIKDPNKIIDNIYTIFKQDESYINYGPNVSEKTKESQKMRRALNFILDMDDIDRAKYPQNEEIYNRLKDELETLLINQITNNFPKDEIELFNVLYSLEGFQLKSKDNREEIEKCKKNIIKQFLINNNNFTIDSLKELLIPFDRQSIYSGREKGERSLFIVTFKDYSDADIRYVKILKTIQEVKQELQKAKSID